MVQHDQCFTVPDNFSLRTRALSPPSSKLCKGLPPLILALDTHPNMDSAICLVVQPWSLRMLLDFRSLFEKNLVRTDVTLPDLHVHPGTLNLPPVLLLRQPSQASSRPFVFADD